jgi:hypothetical protein
MWTAYIEFLKDHPLLSSALQVALLGTFGELLAMRIRLKRWELWGPGPHRFVLKVLGWGVLGITFKYAFAGFHGFVDALVDEGFWFPGAAKPMLWDNPTLLRAFSISLFTNMLFGPMMMMLHRVMDNAIENKSMDWPSLQKAWFTLIWFWIPAHTVTFLLPSYFQVGLAAVWAVALGVILGVFVQKSANIA